MLLSLLAHVACAQTPPAHLSPSASAEAGTVMTSTAETCPSSVDALVAQYPAHLSADEPRLQGTHLVVIRKQDRQIGRYASGKLLEGGCWSVGLGFSPEGTKEQEGDGRTPEGWYRTSDKPWSQWYAAIAIHYPNAEDAQAGVAAQRISAATAQSITRALARGEKPPQTTPLGGEILIHGGGSSSDWTLGCVAMNDADIDALRATLPRAMQADVLILP